MTNMRIVALLVAALVLSGCIRTIATVVTAPVKVAAQAADWATTSQDEADRNRGREIRRGEQREAKERRRLEKEAVDKAKRGGE